MAAPNCLQFRPLTRAELDETVSWAAAEGWNPGFADAEVFWNTDPKGFVGAELEGTLVATGSVVSYDGAFGFMGFFIVRPELRGKGIGTAFWRHRRDLLRGRLQPGAVIGMDGVFAMQDFYAKGGFVFSHRNLRMEGTGAAAVVNASVRPLSEIPYDELASFDRGVFAFPRDRFLKPWIAPRGGSALGAVHEGRLRGFGVVRPCRTGFKIGPLFADHPEVAQDLYLSLSDFAQGQPLFLDTPECNPAALELAARHGMRESFGCARMYYGPAPPIDWDRIYGVTTFELG